MTGFGLSANGAGANGPGALPLKASSRPQGGGGLAGRRYSGLDAAAGKTAATVVESAPPPVDRPWWMKIHGDNPPVSNLEETMDQFLHDPEMSALQALSERGSRRFDARALSEAVPGISREDTDRMMQNYSDMQKFLHYRGLVAERHDRSFELRANRLGGGPGKPGEEEEIDDAAADELHELASLATSAVAMTPSRTTATGGRMTIVSPSSPGSAAARRRMSMRPGGTDGSRHHTGRATKAGLPVLTGANSAGAASSGMSNRDRRKSVLNRSGGH